MGKTKRGGLWNLLGNEGVRPTGASEVSHAFTKGTGPGKGTVQPGTMPRGCAQGNRVNVNINGESKAYLNSEHRAGTPGSV